MVATARRTMTLEEYQALPNDGHRYELIDGELYVTAAPVPDHQDVSSAIYRLLYDRTEARRLGKVYFARIEVQLPTGDIVEPDLVYIRRENLHIRQAKALVGVPDLVVEVLSPSTRAVDLGKKLQRYEAAGIPEYWVAEAARPSLRVFVLRDGRYVEVEPTDGLVASSIVPGLVVDIAALWADASGRTRSSGAA